MGGIDEHRLLLPESSISGAGNAAAAADDLVPRTGTVWTSVAHILTAVVGAGVLTLAWSTAQLGYLAGAGAILLFAGVTYLSAHMLADCYRSPDPVAGARSRNLLVAVRRILGRRHAAACSAVRTVGLFKTGVVYTIVTAASLRAVGAGGDDDRRSMVAFGAVQVVLSFMPSLSHATWLSVVASATSAAYASIGIALAVAKVIADGGAKGSLAPPPASSEKLWREAQAVGNIAFAFPFSVLILEVQDTVKSPPAESVTAKRASALAAAIITFFYLACAVTGYAAFGDDVPGNFLTGFAPSAVITVANVCIIIHIAGAYQVFSQLVFMIADDWFDVSDKRLAFGIPATAIRVSVSPATVCFRTAYVAATTAVAVALPYFNEMVGLAGAFGFWPLVVYFPVEMYVRQMGLRRWSTKAVALRIVSVGCFVVSAAAFAGSVVGLYADKAS